MTRQNRFDLWIFVSLALVMLATRTHSLSRMVHLPDTSWASFFVAGYYIRSKLGFPALFLLAFAVDVVMIRIFGTSGFCFTLAYGMLVPAYGVMWLAGRWAHERLQLAPASLPMLLVLVCGATLGAELISSGGFYAFGGRFAAPTLAGFLPRLERYFPFTLEATLLWTGLAVVCHALVLWQRPDLIPAAIEARDR